VGTFEYANQCLFCGQGDHRQGRNREFKNHTNQDIRFPREYSRIVQEVNLAKQVLCAVSYESSEQHKDTSTTRMAKDVSDTHKMVAYLFARNPFTEHLELFNLVTKVTVDELVNADRASEVDVNFLQNIIGKKVEQHTFRKK